MTPPRWPDGSMVAEDPHAAARRLDGETLGWRIWFGDSTGHFFGVYLGAPVMVEAKTADELIDEIERHRPRPARRLAGPWDATPRTFDGVPGSGGYGEDAQGAASWPQLTGFLTPRRVLQRGPGARWNRPYSRSRPGPSKTK